MGRRVVLAIGMSIVLVAGIVQGAAAARSGGIDGLRRLDSATLRQLRAIEGLGPRGLRADGRVSVVVELAARPVAAFDAQSLARTRQRLAPAERNAIRDRIVTGQKQIEPRVAALGGRVQAAYQDAINGLRVSVPRAGLGRLAALPGVIGIHAIPRYQPGMLNTGRFVKSPKTWTATGRTGNGVTIAVIDTGIDYTHADFAGSGNKAQYAADNGLSRSTGAPFPTAKVIEGWDFAGDDYDADDPAHDVPQPDNDPLDCNGHGTHVAGIAAGTGVKKVGSVSSTYTGAYNSTKFATVNFVVAPGIAPRARLVALKIFGCDGSSDLVVDAIDKAVEMGVDVINMSLGSAFARGDDLTAIAVDNASDAGVVVVGSAGNSGPSAYIHGGVTTGDKGISVAAIDARPTSTDYRELPYFTSGGPRNGDSALKPDITAPGVNVKSAAAGGGTTGVSYSGTSMASPVVAGAAALVIEARPTWSSADVKSVLIGTAVAGKKKIKPAHYDVLLAGGGIVNTYRATTSVAFARTQSAAGASLSFGYDELSGAFSETQTFELVNRSNSSITYALSTSFNGPSHGAVMVLSKTSVTVPAGGTRLISANLKLSATNVRNLPDAIVPVGFSDDGVAYQPLVTVKGVIVATPAAATGRYALRVPFLSVPRGISNVALTSSGVYTISGSEAIFNGTLANTGATNHRATADLYAWGLSDANEGYASNDIRAVGVQQQPCNDPIAGCVANDRLIAFAVSTWGRWSNASTDEFDVAIDVDADQQPDFAVFTTDAGFGVGGDYDGTQAVLTCELDAELACDDAGLFDGFFVDAPPNGSVAWLPTIGSWLGLASAHGHFDYTAASTNLFPSMGTVVDVVEDELSEPAWASWHPWAPPVNSGAFHQLAVGGSVGHVFRASYPNVAAYGAPAGWMIVTADDASGPAQADLVPLGALPTLPPE